MQCLVEASNFSTSLMYLYHPPWDYRLYLRTIVERGGGQVTDCPLGVQTWALPEMMTTKVSSLSHHPLSFHSKGTLVHVCELAAVTDFLPAFWFVKALCFLGTRSLLQGFFACMESIRDVRRRISGSRRDQIGDYSNARVAINCNTIFLRLTSQNKRLVRDAAKVYVRVHTCSSSMLSLFGAGPAHS